MPQPTAEFFDFLDLRFYPGTRSIVRSSDKAKYSIRPKHAALLSLLLIRSGDTVTYKELCQLVWPEIEDFRACRRTMTETKATLEQVLRSILKTDTAIIQTISGEGYSVRFLVNHWENGVLVPLPSRENPSAPEGALPVAPSSPESNISSIVPLPPQSLFQAHPWHVLGSCVIYSSAYVEFLLLETAYGSSQLWQRALVLAPFVFAWIFLTSLALLNLDSKLAAQNKVAGLPILIVSFISVALVLCGCLAFFLPPTPITEATFQTQTAQVAYLKNVALYLLPLAIVFLLIPFHLVAAVGADLVNKPANARNLLLHKPRAAAPGNSLYIKPSTLGLLLLIGGIAALPGNYKLLEQAKAGPDMSRFTLLVILRLILLIGLGAECVLWYSYALNDFKSRLDRTAAFE